MSIIKRIKDMFSKKHIKNKNHDLQDNFDKSIFYDSLNDYAVNRKEILVGTKVKINPKVLDMKTSDSFRRWVEKNINNIFTVKKCRNYNNIFLLEEDPNCWIFDSTELIRVHEDGKRVR